MPIDQAARHCGVPAGMLSKLENGKASISSTPCV
ncbi:helix-turn-helix transcriptional regulator [Cupriavidus basilensis]|uniref:Helix-turn-helix transcriptional regulator n=2 Tax=Cupriavidus basilensis TaxID=68895 RepID=A0ABT6AQS4_9BURK|nr:helix-turn-helix transcriptional regulator [Cupriavidus basilensis]MDF3834979.1 helix-turn-helix transcriptional regulator [Cupriavidus basilensis]